MKEGGADRNGTGASWRGVMERMSCSREKGRCAGGWGEAAEITTLIPLHLKKWAVKIWVKSRDLCFAAIVSPGCREQHSGVGNHPGFLLLQPSATAELLQSECLPRISSWVLFWSFSSCFRTDHMFLKPVQPGLQLAIWGKLCVLHF